MTLRHRRADGAGLGLRSRVQSRLGVLAATIERVRSRELALKLTLKKTAAVLAEAEVPFLLGGGASRWARGGPPMRHDLDFIVTAANAPRALEALRNAGMRPTRIPEPWCLRVWNGDVAVDLIFGPIGLDVTDTMIDTGEEMEILGVTMRVIRIEDDLITKLMSITEQSLYTFESALRAARALREQPDWDEVRRRTKHSPFARAFFTMAEGLGVVGEAGSAGELRTLPDPVQQTA